MKNRIFAVLLLVVSTIHFALPAALAEEVLTNNITITPVIKSAADKSTAPIVIVTAERSDPTTTFMEGVVITPAHVEAASSAVAKARIPVLEMPAIPIAIAAKNISNTTALGKIKTRDRMTHAFLGNLFDAGKIEVEKAEVPAEDKVVVHEPEDTAADAAETNPVPEDGKTDHDADIIITETGDIEHHEGGEILIAAPGDPKPALTETLDLEGLLDLGNLREDLEELLDAVNDLINEIDQNIADATALRDRITAILGNPYLNLLFNVNPIVGVINGIPVTLAYVINSQYPWMNLTLTGLAYFNDLFNLSTQIGDKIGDLNGFRAQAMNLIAPLQGAIAMVTWVEGMVAGVQAQIAAGTATNEIVDATNMAITTAIQMGTETLNNIQNRFDQISGNYEITKTALQNLMRRANLRIRQLTRLSRIIYEVWISLGGWGPPPPPRP